MKWRNQQNEGSVIVSILMVTLFLTTIIYSLIVLANANLVRARGRILLLEAQYAAESGADAAIANFNNNNSSYTGTGASDVTVLTNTLYKATYASTVSAGSNSKEQIISATGKVYAPANASTPKYTRTIQVTAQRTSSSTSTSMVSRNIIDVDSSVKSIQATDIYLNGYINMAKNTTNLIAENITVGGKNTGSSNCSIGGTGNLVKPSSFTHAGQTKTNITLAYNNCISPPGNSSDSNFNVLANQNTITQVTSTYIPFSQYMDSSYQNSPSGCTDWTSGSFPRSIPSTGNTKKTHYPDSSGNISASCGTSGDLSLATGQYTIRDHVHIRANLCAATACTPTFYNPDSGAAGIKFVFIEGTVNFASVQTAAGSGPIVFVVYGSDPSSNAASCPDGGAFYLGNSGNSSASALYVLASNGICLDKTKFGSSPAMGGLSGKNIYVSTNSGTPFDLALDPNFPVSSIPVDLSWKAVRYRRL
ncbi:MAG TPA: hypothetical protein VLF87_03770 [Patescibacteria group bacterium]|nr:hypothetical protein [Candidatus Saccharimonadales bacterium]HSX47076.1 hypothetical protein [Patescibacteria group bacterium]